MATKLPASTYLPIWEAAAAEEIGLCLQVHPDDVMLVANALYDCRKQHGGFENMMLLMPMPPGTIFVRKQEITEID